MRPRRKRFIEASISGATHFKPVGVCMKRLQEIIITFDEYEALRLKDLVGVDQKDASQQMGISQPTFHRLVKCARKKVVDALVNSKAIKIEGGHYIMKENPNIEKTRVAISAFSDSLDGDVNSRFGRCEYFLLIDIDNGEVSNVKSIENSQAGMRGGAGIGTAQMLSENNISSVISGSVGPKAAEALVQFKIATYHAAGSIRTAIKDLIEGKLVKVIE